MSDTRRRQKARALVVLSGGMDSTVCAALAVRDFDAENTAALHVDYGQRTERRERKAFEEICDRLGIKTRLAVYSPIFRAIGGRLGKIFRAIGGSALTDDQIDVPDASVEMGTEIPVTYVPFRNSHLLSAAVSWAEVLGAEKIFIGAVQQDSSGYPDCRPEFYAAFNEAVRTGTKEGTIRIETPLIALRKSEIVRLGLELGAPFDLTWSCYSREDQACGTCDSCVLRMRAFAAAGASDPIPYLSPADAH